MMKEITPYRAFILGLALGIASHDPVTIMVGL